jgi:6-phosphogluconolactonase (cycloisomerase 2 family)
LIKKKAGMLTKINTQSSEETTHATLADKTGKWVIAGNYSSGNFTIIPVK